MKADKNGSFFRKEEWKNMLKKGMPSKLQAVEKDPPKNPGPELQAVGAHDSDSDSTYSPSEYFPKAPPKNPGLKLQAVGKAPPTNPGPKLQAVGKAPNLLAVLMAPLIHLKSTVRNLPPPKNPGPKPRGSIEGGLVFGEKPLEGMLSSL